MRPTWKMGMMTAMLFCLGLSACSLGPSIRSVNSGPPGPPPTSSPDSGWGGACTPTLAMLRGDWLSTWPTGQGPCSGEIGQYLSSASPERPSAVPDAVFKLNAAAMGIKTGETVDVLAVADLRGSSLCVTVGPAGRYGTGSGPAPQCFSSSEFTKRFLQTITLRREPGATLDQELRIACKLGPCSIGKIAGFSLRPK